MGFGTNNTACPFFGSRITKTTTTAAPTCQFLTKKTANGNGAEAAKLKQRLLDTVRSTRRGVSTSEDQQQEIDELIAALEPRESGFGMSGACRGYCCFFPGGRHASIALAPLLRRFCFAPLLPASTAAHYFLYLSGFQLPTLRLVHMIPTYLGVPARSLVELYLVPHGTPQEALVRTMTPNYRRTDPGYFLIFYATPEELNLWYPRSSRRGDGVPLRWRSTTSRQIPVLVGNT